MGQPRVRIDRLEPQPLLTIDYRRAGLAGDGHAVTLPVMSAIARGLPTSLDAIVLTGGLRDSRKVPSREHRRPPGVTAAIWLARMSSERTLPPGNRTGTILAGGFSPVGGTDRDPKPGSAVAVWRAFWKRSRWVAGVAGDNDFSALQEGARQDLRAKELLFLLDGDSVDLDTLRVGGIGGVATGTGGAGVQDDSTHDPPAGHLRAIRALAGVGVDLLVLNWLPDGGLESRPGSIGLKQCLEDLPATVVVCSRTWWDSPLVELHNGTQVLNVTGRVIVLRRPRDIQI